MDLKTILDHLTGIENIEGSTSIKIEGIACDSKAVRDGCLFIAVKGSRFNGEDFINEAIDRGSRAVILESKEYKIFPFKRAATTYIYVKDARRSLSDGAKTFYGDISNNMHIIGVTGTNGKTTTTYLLESLLKSKNRNVGVIGTVNYRFGNRVIPSVNTTPGALELYSLLNGMSRMDIKDCILEVSSHSLDQGRVDTIAFDIAVFTNLTSEHLDYHTSMENYFASKLMLFMKIKKGGYAVINKDDPYSDRIIERVRRDKNADVLTYGIHPNSDIYAKDIQFSSDGVRLKFCLSGGKNDFINMKSILIGRYNVYNILACAGCGIAMGMDMEEIARGIEDLSCLPGRLEKIVCGQDFLVFVDYAHTENGMENVLDSLRELKPRRILTVFGCGGDRDVSKRPNMGRVASKLSDLVFITSDNPRSEEPMDIIKDIIKGVHNEKNNYFIEVDRLKAIKNALKEAKKGDIVLVAGKGHETYQIFKDWTIPFDDREVVREVLCSQSEIS